MIYTVTFAASTVNKRSIIKTYNGSIEVDTSERTPEEWEELKPAIKAKIHLDVTQQKKRIVAGVDIISIEPKKTTVAP